VVVEIEGDEEVTFGVAGLGASSIDRKASLLDFETVDAGAWLENPLVA
jgi:hypothetical protein